MRSSPAPAYSPDLTPSDYHLSQSMQHVLAHTHLSNYEEMQKCTDQWIALKNKFYRRGIQLLQKRWEKVIENNRLYFD